MDLVARVDDYGKPAWIALMILSFIVFWPIGLAMLVFLLWSGRMGCWKNGGRGRWHYEGTDRGPEAWFRGWRRPRSSGNVAFDEYREETLRRLEEEQQEFHDFLRQLRQAKDKAEFDQFMADRRRRRTAPDAPEGPPMPEGPAPQPQA